MEAVAGDTILAGLRWRYATKKFDPNRQIPDADWATLEQVLQLTPSSYGLQPWKFFVVKDPDKRAQLKAASWNQSQVVDASHLVVFALRHDLNAEDIQKLITTTATTRQVPVEKLDGYKKMMLGYTAALSVEAKDHWSAKQVYIALGQFMTAAALLGIDTCPMEGLEPAKYDEILGLTPLGFRTVVACPAGYRAADDASATMAKVRYPLADVVQYL